jgi:hypothetical protein
MLNFTVKCKCKLLHRYYISTMKLIKASHHKQTCEETDTLDRVPRVPSLSRVYQKLQLGIYPKETPQQM